MIATKIPAAVAIKASDKSAETMENPPFPASAKDEKLFIIPTTVPNNPIKGDKLAIDPISHNLFDKTFSKSQTSPSISLTEPLATSILFWKKESVGLFSFWSKAISWLEKYFNNLNL